VLTNTFGGSRVKLDKRGLGGRVAELNAAGARLSLEGAPGAIIAGSVGPTGEFVEPLGTLSEANLEAMFAEQIAAMLGAGLHVICVETMTALEEAACAIRAAKRLDRAVEVIATMTFDKTPSGYRTMMGIGPEQAASALVEAGADVVGSNCGNGVRNMVDIAREFRRFTDRPILIHANAGMPELVDGQTVFRETPQDMADQVTALLEAGADIIGGCCGTTPDHIAAIRAAVDAHR
jgi:5-methyltetrahydrofolate--homocysteine methyltransferase